MSNSFINEFELSFDYPSVPEVLCVTINDFDDFEEEEIPPELKNLIDFEEERHAKPNMDETQTINIGTEENPKLVLIGSTLTLEEKSELTNLLKEYKDVFAWSYQDMPGIDPEIVQHRIPLIGI